MFYTVIKLDGHERNVNITSRTVFKCFRKAFFYITKNYEKQVENNKTHSSDKTANQSAR
jgi:hypothetical protein